MYLKRIEKIEKFLFFFVISLIIQSFSLYTQFKHISIQDGLSQSQIHAILQDKEGFMWFGTLDGLNKHDGYQFKIYKRQPDSPTTISDNNILSLCIGDSSVLWVGTEGGGLNCFNIKTEEFKIYKHNPENPSSLSNDFIEVIYRDRSGILWIGTQGGGLNRFNPRSEIFSHYKLKSKVDMNSSQNHVTSIIEGKKGNLWIGTKGGLFRLNNKREQLVHYTHDHQIQNSLIHNEVNALIIDSIGFFWVGTSAGLSRMDLHKGSFKHFQNNPKDASSLSDNFVKCLYEDSLGNLWVGTKSGGLNRFERKTETFTRFKMDPVDYLSLSENNINAIFEDQSGVLWIATANSGIDKLSLKKKPFKHIRKRPFDPNSLCSKGVWSIWESQDGLLWMGTYKGLTCWDRRKDKYTHYFADGEGKNHLSHNVIRALYGDSNGYLWIGTDGGGVNRLNLKTGKIRFFKHDPSNPTSISSNQIRTIYEDSSGTLWFGTLDGGLNTWNPEKEIFNAYKIEPDKPFNISNNSVFSILEDSAGLLWVGTLGGVNVMDRKTETFIHYQHNPGDPTTISDNGVGIIYEDTSGNLWIGTDRGLNRFERRKKTFIHYTIDDGLANDFIYGILEDNQGNLWLSTNGGISKFDPKTRTFRNYDFFDGLLSNEFNAGSFFKNSEGEMFFGGIIGIDHFFPQTIRDNTHIPPIVITSVKKFNQPVNFNKILLNNDHISFSIKENFLTFEFASLDYNGPEKNQYAYKMEGFDDKWYEIGNRRLVTYTNLDPATYTFRVKGSNNDNVWNEDGITMKIRIIPAFWQTLWFKISFVVFLSGIVFLFIKTRIRRVESHRKKLELEVSKRTSELEQKRGELERVNLQQKELLHELKQSEEKYRRIFDNIRDVHFEETIDGVIQEISPSIEKISLYKREELLGESLFSISADPLQREEFVKKISITESLPDYETILIDKDGRNILCSINARLEMDKKGKPAKIIGSLRDITERIQSAKEKRLLEERLNRLEKMEAIGRLAGGVAHDLNNILSAIVSYPDLLLMNLPEDSPHRKPILTMQQSGQRATAIVQDLLTLARRGVGSIETVNLNVVVRDYLKSPECGKLTKFHPYVQLKKDLQEGLFNIKASAIHMTKTVMNLVSNAAEAMPEGGNLHISTFNQHLDKSIKGYDQNIPEGDYVVLKVVDEGVGISSEDMKKIFEPFYSKKEMGRSGTGLGMAVVWGTVKDCKGYINIISFRGKGTTIELYFPVTRDEILDKKPSKPIEDYIGNHEHILVVDDIDEQREIATMLLTRLGYSVSSIASGEEAIEYVKKHPVDLVILDMIMDPGIDGLDTYKEIKQVSPKTKAIITSGFTETEQVKEALKLGAGFYIKKPYSLEAIGIAVKNELMK